MANFFKPSAKKNSLAQTINIKINRLDLNGTGVGQYQKKPVFVDGALTNEVVKVKIVEQKNKYSRARLLSVEERSELRVKANCSHFSNCGGCDLQHLAFSAHIEFKQRKVTELFARNDINQYLPWQNSIRSQPWHYRRKARIGVQCNKKGEATIGFRQKSTNQLIAIKKCSVLVEPLSDVFQVLNELLAKLSGKNAIGHIEVIATEQVTLVVRQLAKLSTKDKSIWLEFANQQQWQVFIDDGKQVVPLTQQRPLRYSINKDVTLNFNTDNFIQVNHGVNQLMVKQALEWLTLSPTDKVLDLFCGLGNFTLPMAAATAQVIGIEGIDSMVVQAMENAKRNGIENCQFYQANLNTDWQTESWAQEKFDKVLLDPARAGAYEALQQLVKFNIKQVLYVSCDPATLARDSALLISQGYKISKIALVDMFSQTKHIETMVLFTRNSTN